MPDDYFYSPLAFGAMLLAGNVASDVFFGQDFLNQNLLLANAVSAGVGAFVSDMALKKVNIAYFLSRDENAHEGRLKNVVQDIYEGIGVPLLVGSATTAAVRYFGFGVPFTPAIVGGAACAGLTWLVFVRPKWDGIRNTARA